MTLLPLSTVQQATVEWICAGGASAFGLNVSLSLRLRGPLCRSALERALGYVLGRHEGLRSRVQRADGTFLQFFADSAEVYDLTPVRLDDIEAAEARIAERLAARLDLERKGPLCAELLQLSERDHVLLLVISHTATDTHADELLLSELLSAYASYARGSSPSLPAAMSFTEYLASETQAGTRLNEMQLKYWGEVIQGATPAIPRRAGPATAHAPARGRILSRSTSAATTRALEDFAANSKVSLMAVLSAVMLLAVSKEFGLEDVCAFTTHAGRDSSRLRTLGASTGRDFLIRMVLPNGGSLAQLAKSVQTKLIRAAISSRLPFTHERALAQLPPEPPLATAERAHLFITDALRITNGVDNPVPELAIERVMPGPLLQDGFAFEAGWPASDAAYVGVLNVLLRRDLSPEPGHPISFVAVFIDDTIEEAVVRAFLSRVCAIAERVTEF